MNSYEDPTLSYECDREAELAALKTRLAEAQNEADRRTREVEACYVVQRDLKARLAEAEREQDTLLAMIRHQRDVLRECLPYLNESMAGRRPGRSADDIRAVVKALTADQPSVCRHAWATDGIHGTQCVKCGAMAADNSDATP